MKPVVAQNAPCDRQCERGLKHFGERGSGAGRGQRGEEGEINKVWKICLGVETDIESSSSRNLT